MSRSSAIWASPDGTAFHSAPEPVWQKRRTAGCGHPRRGSVSDRDVRDLGHQRRTTSGASAVIGVVTRLRWSDVVDSHHQPAQRGDVHPVSHQAAPGPRTVGGGPHPHNRSLRRRQPASAVPSQPHQSLRRCTRAADDGWAVARERRMRHFADRRRLEAGAAIHFARAARRVQRGPERRLGGRRFGLVLHWNGSAWCNSRGSPT